MYCSSLSGKKYFVIIVSNPITKEIKDTLAVIIVAKPVYETFVILRNAIMIAVMKIIANIPIIARHV